MGGHRLCVRVSVPFLFLVCPGGTDMAEGQVETGPWQLSVGAAGRKGVQ